MMLRESAKPRSELALFLKFLRRRVDPDVRTLGTHARLPSRLGKRLTQAELAEAIGVSREWYAVLESAPTTRASPRLLDRVADVLMLAPEERARLFQLAVPDVWRVQPQDESIAVLEPEPSSKALEQRHGPILQAFSKLRSGAKRLWSASTVDEAFEIAAEEVSMYFADAGLVFFVQRVAKGRWKHPFVVDRGLGARNADMYAELASSLTRGRFDEIVLYPLLSEPGDIGSRDTYRATSVATAYEAELVKHKLAGWSFLHARISSRRGIIGGITVKHARERDYSDTDRAVISAIASVASLALSVVETLTGGTLQ
jgi:transcriptional regulator with XRE-family HTH domain